MGMFDKFCNNKGTDFGSSAEESLPNQFDARRRTSVSAECWMHSQGPITCGGNSSRSPPCRETQYWLTKNNAQSSANGSTSNVKKSIASATGATGAQETRGPSSTVETGPATATGSANSDNLYTLDDPSPNSFSSDIPSSRPANQSPEEISALSRAEAALRNTIFFEELNNDLMEQVLNALQFRSVEADTEVIHQGEEGDHLFLLDEGEVEFILNGESMGTATNGSTFGELALLYNSPRAATVRTLKPCKFLTLDRITFKRIMVAKHSRKRLHSQQVLSQIDVFAQLPESTQLRIADALHPATFKSGEHVIKQGDFGTDFYLIDEGTVDVISNGRTLAKLGPGSYFGELALIYHLPRSATVTVNSKLLKVEVLSSRGFEKLIGPDLIAELRKRDPRASQTSRNLPASNIQIQA